MEFVGLVVEKPEEKTPVKEEQKPAKPSKKGKN